MVNLANLRGLRTCGFAMFVSGLLTACTPTSERCIDAVNEKKWLIFLEETRPGYENLQQLNEYADAILNRAVAAAASGNEAECWRLYRSAMTDAPFN